MNNPRLIFIICFLGLLFQANAQENAVLNLRVVPKDALFKIDGISYEGTVERNVLSAVIELDPGTHLLEFWHPALEMESLEMTLEAGETYYHTQPMRTQNQAYIDHKKILNAYNRDKITRLTAPILLVGANAAGWAYTLNRPDRNDPTDLLAEIDIARFNYFISFTSTDSEAWENRYNELVSEYEDMRRRERTRLLTHGAVMLGVGYLSFKLLQGLYRREGGPPPIFTPGEPFTIELGSSQFGPVFALKHTF